MVSNDDHSSTEAHSPPEGDIPGHGEVVQLEHVGDGAEPGQEGGHLLEVRVTELDQRRGGKHSLQRDQRQSLQYLRDTRLELLTNIREVSGKGHEQ